MGLEIVVLILGWFEAQVWACIIDYHLNWGLNLGRLVTILAQRLKHIKIVGSLKKHSISKV